jgi:general secretion pathway protein I
VKQRGFTLLEVLVATLVMAIAVAGLMGAISTSIRNAARLTDHDRGVQLGRQKMDELMIATGLEKGVPFQGTWGPEVTGGSEIGWLARLTPFELPKSPSIGRPFVERIELEIWWMSGTQRRSFRLEGYHRALLTRPDLAAARALAQAPLNITQLGLPQ